ncbi:hypothetical protein L249_7887, partial [Ophiocordyceps polyrhachis-furcata BCC 54312]
PKARHNALSHSGAIARSSQRSARCTYSGHSTRLISAQGSRHIDRRAILIAVIALDQSDRRAVLIAVIAPDLDSRTKALRMDSLLIREKLQGALGSKTYNKSEEAGLEQT